MANAPARPGPGLRARARLVAGLAQTWVRRPGLPTRVVLDLTRRCNLRCAMCRTWARQSDGELTAAEIDALLARLGPGLLWLDLTGGEPFLRRDLPQIFDAVATRATALGVLHFQTNGWFTARVLAQTEALRRRLSPQIELIVTVSIDGPAALHDRIRGVPGAFARAAATAAGLRDAGIDVHVGTTITRDNAEHLPATWAALRDALPQLPRARWHLNAMQISPHFYDNAEAAPLRVAVDDVGAHVFARGLPRSLPELMESIYLVNLAFTQRGEPSGVGCQALRSTLFVSPEGELYPCHLYDRPLGNVREHDVVALWHAASTLQVRGDIERLACGGCFSACEAYPALAGAPLQTLRATARRGLRLWREHDARAGRTHGG